MLPDAAGEGLVGFICGVGCTDEAGVLQALDDLGWEGSGHMRVGGSGRCLVGQWGV